MRNLIFVFVALLGSVYPAFSQLDFQKITGIGGKPILSYVLGDQNGNLYAVTDGNSAGTVGAIYRSQNGGTSWQPLNFSGNYVRIAPDGTLYGYKPFKLYRSVNQGQSWTAAQNQPPGGQISLITANGSLLSGAYRSVDGGVTWGDVQNPGTGVNKLLAGKDGLIYGFANGYVNRSADDGQTWQLGGFYVNTDISTNLVFQASSGRLMILRPLSQGFYYSDDQGATWTNYSQNTTGSEYPVSIVQTPTGHLWLVTNAHRYYSDDNGATWTNDSPTTYDDPLKNLSITPDGTVWSNLGGTLYRTTDAALQNWIYAADGMEEPSVLDIQIRSDDDLYVATTGGLFRSGDGGINWTHFYQEPIYKSANEIYFRLRFCFDQQGNIILCDGIKVWRIDPQTGSRVDITPADSPASSHFYSAFSLPQGGLLISGINGLTRTSFDNGSTWSTLNLSAPAGTAAFGMITGVKIAADSIVYMYSYDGYALQYNPLNHHIHYAPWLYLHPTYALDLGPSGSIHIGAGGEYCTSEDFAQTWDCHSTPGTVISDLVVNAAGSIFYSDREFGGGLHESVDGGQSWNTVYGPASLRINCLRLSPSGRLYLAVLNQGLFHTATSTTTQPIIKGSVFNDLTTADCDREATEPGLIGIKTRLEGNGATYVGVSNQYGQYAMPALTGDLKAQAIPPSNYWAVCQSTLTVAANATGIVADSLVLGLQPVIACPKMEVSLSAPFLRRCFGSYMVVDYCNTGTLVAENATVEVTLDSFLVFESADAPLIAQNGQKLTFQIGDVAINHCGQFKILVTVSCAATLGQEHCSKAHIYPDQDCMNTWTGAWLETSAACSGDSVVLQIHNRGSAMPSPAAYTVLHTDFNYQGTVLLPADGIFSRKVPALHGAVFFSVEQATGFPYGAVSALLAGACASSDSALAFQHYADTYAWEDEECVTNIGSFDPNDKSATPPGFGDAHYLPRDQSIEYQIRFQNTGTDKAATVVIRDQLSPWLDLSTVRPIASSHPYLFEINGQELIFRFPNIQLPDSTTNEAASHGFLRFRIRPRADLPDGTALDNQARIYFDFNDPVLTNTTHYTLGMPVVSATQTPDILPALLVSPNPSGGPAVVEWPAALPGNAGTLYLTDMTGREILRLPVEGRNVRFDLPEMASGLYLLSLRTADGRTLAVGKWVKQ